MADKALLELDKHAGLPDPDFKVYIVDPSSGHMYEHTENQARNDPYPTGVQVGP